MSIVIGVPRTRNEFINIYPWFDLELLESINRQFESDRLKYKIRDHIKTEFPELFRNQCIDSETWTSLRNKLDSYVSSGIDQINTATNRHVSSLVDNKEELISIRVQIMSDIIKKYDSFQSALESKNYSAEKDRNYRVERCEKNINELKNRQFWTFLGGTILGGFIGFIAKSI